MNWDEPLTLKAGPLSGVIYRGDVRYLTVGGKEVVRRLFFGVRDSFWGTAPIELKHFYHEQRPNGFTIRYQATAHSIAGSMPFSALISANVTAHDVSLSMEVEGIPTERLLTNRTGLSVLHPIAGLVGQSCRVETPNGAIADTAFPTLISPHCLFSGIQAMSYCVDGLPVTIRLYGELFEAEDQRNWADTSFKTYSRPLDAPRPYVIEPGQTVRQAVSVVVKTAPTDQCIPDAALHLRLLPHHRALPPVGLRFTPGQPLWRSIRELNAAHFRIDAGVGFEHWEADLNAVTANGVAVELAVHVSSEQDLNDIATALTAGNCRLASVLVYEIGQPLPNPHLVDAATRAFPGARVGPGTVGNFAEINRNRTHSATGTVTAYAVNPQVHAMDDLSIMENLAALGDAVQTFRSFCPNSAVAVGPVTLHRVADPFSAGSDGRLVPPTPDARQASQLAAAWAVGVIKYLAESGADAITLFETAGPGGLLAADESPWPVFHVLAAVCEFANGEVISVSDPAPLHVICLALSKNGRLRLIVANTRWHSVNATVEHIGSMTLSAYEVRILDLPANGALQQ